MDRNTNLAEENVEAKLARLQAEGISVTIPP
jgi:hypothetical protein